MGSPTRPETECLHHITSDSSPRVYSQKKTFRASERANEIYQEKRREYLSRLAKIPEENRVYVDEAGSNLAMTPAYAWAFSGMRAFDSKPAQRGSNISMIGALKNSGMQALYPYDGSIDAQRFTDFIEHKLKPHLNNGDVIIMDNCRTHYAKLVTDKLKALSIDTLFLPPYSPELNPIEESWSVIKTKLKRKKARNIPDYIDALLDAKKSIDNAMAEAFFKHAQSFQTFC